MSNFRFAPIPVTHELISVFVKSLSVNDWLHFMCHERAEKFFHRAPFYFFLESIFQIGESEHKLGPIAFRQQTVNCGMTP
jgi:hypothetical protein